MSNAMRPFSTGGVYANNLGEEGTERIEAAYGENRLVALKNKYDPTNFFRLNQNIKPVGERCADVLADRWQFEPALSALEPFSGPLKVKRVVLAGCLLLLKPAPACLKGAKGGHREPCRLPLRWP
jgi:hypothetical protein